MTSAQVAAATPQFIPSSFHFEDYVNGWNNVLQARTFLNSVIFVVFAVGIQWALCISGGLAIAKMRFPGRTRDHDDVRDLAADPGRHDGDPGVRRHEPVRSDQHVPRADHPDRGADRVRHAAVPPVHRHDAAGAVRRGADGRRRVVADPAPPRGAARPARHRGLPRDLRDHRVEHVPVAAPRRERAEGPGAERGRRGDRAGSTTSASPSRSRSCTRRRSSPSMPMVVAFLLVQPAFVRGLTGSGVE